MWPSCSYDKLCFDAECFEGVPEFVGLRRGTFAITIAKDDESGRLDVFMKIMRELLA
jgi:hypothetical protein